MTINEPMTLLTDLLLSGWTLYLGVRLTSSGGGTAQRWWGAAFLAATAAAALGGLWHGFVHQLPVATAAWLWTSTLWAIGAASACFLVAAAYAVLGPHWRRWLTVLAGVKLALYLVLSLGRDDFLPALLDYAPTLLLVLLLFAWRYRSVREASAPWVGAGIVTAFIAAAVQAAQLAPHPAFNHNDLYHLLQMLAFWLLYRGGMLLQDRQK